MKQFLYGELSEEASQAIEERLLVNDELFYELADLENDLVDRYVCGKLSGEELRRFERALTKSEERRERVKDARALQRRITERKQAAAPAPVKVPRPSFWSLLSEFFSLRAPAMRYATAALVVLLGLGTAWFSYDGYRARRELARVRDEQARRESDLQRAIEEARRQMSDEQGRKLSESESRVRQLEAELETLRHERGGTQPTSGGLFVATVVSLGRGPSEEFHVRPGAGLVEVKLPLDPDADYDEYVIEGARASGQKVVHERGRKYLVAALPARNLRFTVVGRRTATGVSDKIDDYRMTIRRR